MPAEPLVNVYDARSEEYRRGLHLFLAHTDEKTRTYARLSEIIDALPARRAFIDVGAGTGMVTARVAERFERTLAIEPNASLCAELRLACPGVDVRQQTVMATDPPIRAELVLCSHVLYYVPPDEWQACIATMASWVAPHGELVIVLQSPDTDSMDMFAHFHRRRFDLSAVGDRFRQLNGARYRAGIERVTAHVATPDLESAVAIAEFMLNVAPMPEPPARRELEDYVRRRFARDAGYRFSCDQDFLRIAPDPEGGPPS